MVDGVGNNTRAFSFKELGDTIVAGLKAIGNKIAEFGGKIVSGLASIFSSLGRSAANAGNNAHPAGASAGLLRGETFSAEEKRAHLDQALESDFYKALSGGRHGYVNQANFTSIAEAVLQTPRTAAAMKAYGVSLAEAVAISMYTSNAFNDVNGALRNKTGDAGMEGLAKAFTDGLAKLPSFDGNPVEGPDGSTYYQCWRGAKLPKEVGERYLIGSTVSDPGIMSSTFAQGEKFPNCNYDMVLLLKPGSAGKDISAFSDKPTECEVAFPPDVEFDVISRHLDTGGALPPEMEKTYHPGFQGSMPMGTVNIVMKEV